MVSYSGLERQLKIKGITKTELVHLLGISSRTIAKIAKGEKISSVVIRKLCNYFSCTSQDICREISSNKILQTLRDEKNAKISGGLYHELQVRLTYNSNHMEGSRLTEKQTRLIFETNTIGSEYGVPVDDILETVHHFKAIDYVIDCSEEKLTEGIIKKLHFILKHDTKDSTLEWFAVGDYKKKANTVGGKETTKPCEVSDRMRELLDNYNSKSNITIRDIIEFHADFENIHPFQDGNGRVGRLVALKECLCHNIVPFIIEDSKKMFYYRGFAEWEKQKGFLIDTCLDGQDLFKRLLDLFGIEYDK